MQSITSQKQGQFTEADRVALAALLVKAGYKVWYGKERPPNNPKGQLKPCVFYEEQQ